MWNTSLPLPGALMGPVTATARLPVTVTTSTPWPWPCRPGSPRSPSAGTCAATPAALLGGLVYGFSPAMIAQSSSHLHLTLGAVLPLLLLLLLAVPPLGSRQGRHAVGGLAAAAVVFAVLAAWPLAHQLLGPQRVVGDIQESSRNGNDRYSIVVPTRIMAVTPAAALEVSGRFVGRVGELNGYLGAPPVAVVVFTAVRWWRSGVVRVAFLTGLVMLVLSMGERLHVNGQILDAGLPWAAMRSLPLIENVIPTRLMLTANLFFALLLAIFVDRARRPGP